MICNAKFQIINIFRRKSNLQAKTICFEHLLKRKQEQTKTYQLLDFSGEIGSNPYPYWLILWPPLNSPPVDRTHHSTIFLYMHLLLLMNVIDFIWTGFAVLWGTEENKKFKMKMCPAEFEPSTSCLFWMLIHCPIPFFYAEWDFFNMLKTFSVSSHKIEMNTCDKTCIKFLLLGMNWNWLSDKICISYTNVEEQYKSSDIEQLPPFCDRK